MSELYINSEEYCDLYNVKLFSDMSNSGRIILSYIPGSVFFAGKICITGEDEDLLILKLKMNKVVDR